MLTRLLAPAKLFLFGPQNRSGNTNDRQSTSLTGPVDKSGPERLASVSPPNSDTIQPDNVYSSSISRKLNIFQNISAEEFASKLLKLRENPESGTEKNLKIDLNIDYKFKQVEKQTSNEQRHVPRRYSRKTAINRYVAAREAHARISGHEGAADLYYRQSEKVLSKISVANVENYRGVKRKVVAAFRYDFSLDFSFLAQFNRQTEQLDSLDSAAAGEYLNITNSLIDSSTAATKSFFNAVDVMLDNSRSGFLKRVNMFFDQLKQVYSDDTGALDADRERIVSQVTGFFDNVGKLLDAAEQSSLEAIEGHAALPENRTDLENPDPPSGEITE